MIEISQLRVVREGKTICAVDELSVAAGDRLAILGANGSGKTTLLRVLAGLTRDYAGSCRIATEPRRCTYLHQQPFLFRGTVLANARYGERNEAAQGNGTGQGTTASEWLDRLQVGHLAERTTADLSGGERRRIALARALATQPQLLLLDEPLADLDDNAKSIVCNVLTQLLNTTLVVASPTTLPDGLVDKSFTMSLR